MREAARENEDSGGGVLDEQHRPCRVDDGDLGAKRDGMPPSRFVRRQPLTAAVVLIGGPRTSARADRISLLAMLWQYDRATGRLAIQPAGTTTPRNRMSCD